MKELDRFGHGALEMSRANGVKELDRNIYLSKIITTSKSCDRGERRALDQSIVSIALSESALSQPQPPFSHS